MKKKYIKNSNYIKVNLNYKNKTSNKINNSYGNPYIKVKDKNDLCLERNKNIRLINSTLSKITKRDYKEKKEQNNHNLSLLPYSNQQKNVNSTKIEEFNKLQRNLVSIRRKEYSLKVKDVSSKKQYRSNKYNIKKIITIQKWIKGYLLRSFLSNACECETIMNDFIKNIKKYIFLKINIFQKLKKKYINNNNLKDNIIIEKKCSVNIADNISISIINTNNNTNTFTNNNTFSLCQDTPENLGGGNRKLIINPRKNNSPSIRELLMANFDIQKSKNNSSITNNHNKTNLNNLKNISRAKSLNDIKNINIEEKIYSKNIYEESNINSKNLNKKNNNGIKNIKDNNKQELKTPNLRSLLFNNNNNNTNKNTNTNISSFINKTYKKPINNLMYITKESYYYNNNIVNYSPKSEKLNMPKIYYLSLEEDDNINNNHLDNKRKENGLFDNIIIEEIKEVKEDEEEDSQSLIDIKKNTTIVDNEIIVTLKNNESQSQSIVSDIQNVQKENQTNSRNNINNKVKNYYISSSSFHIKSCNYDKRKMFIVFLLKKQIMFCLKPYIFNLLKQFWINKLSE